MSLINPLIGTKNKKFIVNAILKYIRKNDPILEDYLVDLSVCLKKQRADIILKVTNPAKIIGPGGKIVTKLSKEMKSILLRDVNINVIKHKFGEK